ncbi:hypothetical protein Amet_0123 [Alkaliphilus metalliredigens QYMF]|uniref:Uncharacterized protein n=1 Tax=Alkaliphilus metalliredigens (strain QYMF) TaxID=293826 RepID=A6TJJ5_ALKMQ|nr:hypothetical protein [Alkaliphilus metalliredigens]ABR46363.1 hypothetical protein Amet_0123 [Alkaliphilus metalliredigens QYMF]
MKKTPVLIMMLVTLFSILTIGSVSAIQDSTKEISQDVVYDYNLLQEHYERSNNKALEYILENKTIEGINTFRTSEYDLYVQGVKNNEIHINGVTTDSIELVEVIDDIFIDSAYSTIYIYSDSSFIIESMKFIDTSNDKIIEATVADISVNSADSSYTYVVEDFDIPNRTPIRAEAWYTVNLGLVKFQLNTFIDVEDVSTVNVAYHNTNGSYSASPTLDLVEQSSRELNDNNLSNVCFTEGLYTLRGGFNSLSDSYIQKAIVLENSRLLVTSYLYFDQ